MLVRKHLTYEDVTDLFVTLMFRLDGLSLIVQYHSIVCNHHCYTLNQEGG